jgi:hypothetical protein
MRRPRPSPRTALALSLTWGCLGPPDSIKAPPPKPAPDGAAPAGDSLSRGEPVASEFIDIDFPAAYNFLATTRFTEAQRGAQWSRFYRGRWVRLTGELRAFSHDGLQLAQLGGMTFEVQLLVTQPELSRLRQTLVIGRFYNYVGRLRRVDDWLRVFVIEQGMVLGADEFGVPGMLGTPPNPAATDMRVPPPPRPWNINSPWGPVLRW